MTGKHAANKQYPYETWEDRANYPERTPVNAQDNDHSGLAIGAFVTSLFLPLLGLILGIIAFKQDKQVEGRPTGFAKAAIWIGSVFTLVGTVLMIVMMVAFMSTPVPSY